MSNIQHIEKAIKELIKLQTIRNLIFLEKQDK